jgi:hypothetical protein
MSKEKKKSWIPRKFEDGDEGALQPLYENATGNWPGINAWRWLFHDAPAGNAYTWLADHDRLLAGQYSIVPIDMQICGKRLRGAQSLDTMTHSNYRMQGIFVSLAREVYKEAAGNGIGVVYGFPKSNSFPGLVRHLEFAHLADIKASLRPLRAGAALKAKLKIPIVPGLAGRVGQAAFDLFYSFSPKDRRGVTVETASEFSDEVDKLFESLSGVFANMVVRDARFLNWRYTDRPNRDYDIFLAYRGGALCGYCVIGSTERRGFKIGCIMDIFTDPSDRDVFSVLVGRALHAMLDKNAVVASCMITNGSPFEKYLKRLGFIFLGREFPYVFRVLKPGESDAAGLADMSSWHISYGDTDFI